MHLLLKMKIGERFGFRLRDEGLYISVDSRQYTKQKIIIRY